MKRYIRSNNHEYLDDFLTDFAYETCDLGEPYTESEFAEFKQRCRELGYAVTKRDFMIYLDKVDSLLQDLDDDEKEWTYDDWLASR